MEWLASKIGVMIAIGVLTAFVFGLFSWQHSAMIDSEGQKAADSISGLLDNVGSLEAATVANISFGRDGGQLPTNIGGKPYYVNITRDSVIITSGGRTWMSRHVTGVIPQNLSERSYGLAEYESREYMAYTGERPSNGNFFIERATIYVSGETRYVTLVYW